MPKATLTGGKLSDLDKCYVIIPGFGKITLNNLPDISDSKSAAYNDEPVIGRASPLKTYSHSENRSISMQIHFYVQDAEDVFLNIAYTRAIQSATYPRNGSGDLIYKPPPICRLRCGNLLADDDLCVILRSCSVKYPADVAWDEVTYTPYKIDVDTTWEAVYKTSNLPGQECILRSGSSC